MNIRGIDVLILCADKEAFDAVETHLVYKGVNVRLTTSVEKALSQIDTNPPHYCIVSVNHPDNMARKLLGMLQGTTVQAIPAGEINDADTVKMIDDIGVEHNVYPPLNGPRTETLLQYLEKIRLKDVEAPSIDYTKESKDFETNELVMETNLKAGVADLSEEIKSSGGGAAPSEESSAEDDKMALLEKAIAYESGQMDATSPGEPEDASADREDDDEGVDMWHIFDETMHGLEGCEKVDEPEYLSEVSQFYALALNNTKHPGYIFAAVEGHQQEDAKSVYKQIENQLVEMVEEFTHEKVNLQCVELDQEHPFDFETWIYTLNGSMQSFKVKGQTITWAYVDHQPRHAEVKESANPEFCTVSLSDISPELQLPHDLYIHLPRNDKYLKYTKEGGKMASSQKEKLENKNVSEMHVKKNDVEKFKDYKFEKDVTELFEESIAEVKKAS